MASAAQIESLPAVKARELWKLGDAAVVLVYSSVVLWTLQYHEKWADEAQAWLIARHLDLRVALRRYAGALAHDIVDRAARFSCEVRSARLHRRGVRDRGRGSAALPRAVSALHPLAARFHLRDGLPIRPDLPAIYTFSFAGIPGGLLLQGRGQARTYKPCIGDSRLAYPARHDPRGLSWIDLFNSGIANVAGPGRYGQASLLRVYCGAHAAISVHCADHEANTGCRGVCHEGKGESAWPCFSASTANYTSQNGCGDFGRIP